MFLSFPLRAEGDDLSLSLVNCRFLIPENFSKRSLSLTGGEQRAVFSLARTHKKVQAAFK